MKRSRMAITHPTSSSDEVNVAQPGSDGAGCSIVPTNNRFRCFVPSASYIQGFAICIWICIGICQCDTIVSLTRTIASRTRVARERLAAIPVTSIVMDFSRGSLNK